MSHPGFVVKVHRMKPNAYARLLLMFALLFVQTGGLMHEVSHIVVHHTQDHTLPHDKRCDLCAAYAQMGSALGSPVLEFKPPSSPLTLADTIFGVFFAAPFISAFAARAPPISA